MKKKKSGIKVDPVVVDGVEHKIKDIDLPTKTKIMNELISVANGEPNFELFVNILQIVGFSDDEILFFSMEETTQIGNRVIASCNTKKKKKSS